MNFLNSNQAKNFVVLLTEFSAVFLMALGVLPLETSLFLTGLLIFYFIFSPLEDSLWLFIASIPLFVALPLTENFDSMANWRILSAVLFLVWLGKFFLPLPETQKIKTLFSNRLFILISMFLLLGCLSLLVAGQVWVGVKKLLFLINIFLVFIMVKDLISRNKEFFYRIINALKKAIGLVLAIGFLQFLMVFFVPLYDFWQFWARKVIPIFYGQNLGDLLSHSNTWFSYYDYLPATLRMFSVFPDSHSFAFFCILALPFFLMSIFLPNQEKKSNRFVSYLFLIFCLLAIIFSGSRGAWVAAAGALLGIFFVILLRYSPTLRSKTDFFIPGQPQNYWKLIQLIVGSLIIFFLLFPISSGILLLNQISQVKGLSLEKVSLFERTKTITDFDELSVRSRIEIWGKTVQSITKHSFLGVGIGNYPLVLEEKIDSAKKGASAHSLYLDIAAEMGILALLVVLAIFWQFFKTAWQIFCKGQSSFFQIWAGFFVLALFWIFGYSLFDVVLLNDKVFLFFVINLGLLYASFSFYKPSHL